MSTPIRVLLVDDHALVRDALAEHLSKVDGLHVVACAKDAEEATMLSTDLRPDIILMDIDMPGIICFDAARRIMATCPSTRIIFLSAFFHDHYIEQALAVQARGYITKSEPPERVVSAIREVAAGGSCYSEQIRSRLVMGHGGVFLAREGKGPTRASTLTPREIEVLRYIARGLPKKDIAQTMHISTKTVENHSANIMTKLDIHDRVELARYAIREGLAEA